MATLKLTIFKAKALKDGRHKIRVAVCHKQETCYIVTRFIIDDLSQFKHGQVVKRPDAAMVNTKLRNLLNEYQEKLDDIRNISIYSCKQVKDILAGSTIECRQSTFQSVSQSYIDDLKEEDRISYADLLDRNCKYFTEFTKGDFLLSDITPSIINNYARFLRSTKKIGDTTIGMMMSRTRTIINRGIKQQDVRYEVHPFINYSIPSAPVRELDISMEALIIIRNASPKERKYRVAHDIFCLSFYLYGINLIDLSSIDFRNKEKIEFIRTKSRNTTQGVNEIVISIPEPARVIINKWMDKNSGKLDFRYKFSYTNFSKYITRTLSSFAKSLGIKQKVVYYSARKTFAQIASDLGIPDSVIDYCLGHSSKSKGIIRFYTKIRYKQAEIAINRVIDYLDHPDTYKDYIEMKADIMMMKI